VHIVRAPLLLARMCGILCSRCWRPPPRSRAHPRRTSAGSTGHRMELPPCRAVELARSCACMPRARTIHPPLNPWSTSASSSRLCLLPSQAAPPHAHAARTCAHRTCAHRTSAAAPQSAAAAHDSASPLLDLRSPALDPCAGRPGELVVGRIRPEIGCAAAGAAAELGF
jgi:hypothetical protein